MKKNKKHYRQGDVLITEVSEIPPGLKQTKKVVLALGEATGHHHSILTGAVGYGEELAEFFEVTQENVQLIHQEHNPIDLGKKKYRTIRQFEYSPKELVKVQD